MTSRQGGANRASGVARGRLYPQIVKNILTQQLAVRDAVQCDTAGQAKIALPGGLANTPGEFDYDLFRHGLDRGGEIHFTLRQHAFRRARRTAEQLGEPLVGHRQAGAVIEVRHIQVERAVLLDVDQVLLDEIGVFWLAIGGKPHHLVLARIDLEARVVGERRIQQPKRMRKMDLLVDRQIVTLADRKRRGRPFANAVHRQHRRLFKGRGEECGSGVAQVMLGKQQPLFPVDFLAEMILQRVTDDGFLEELFFEPYRKRRHKAAKPARCEGEVGLEQSLELQKRLVVENDMIDIGGLEPAFGETIIDGVRRKPRVVLLAGESLFLRSRDDLAIHDQTCRRVVIIGRQTKYFHRSEQRVDERGNDGTLRKDQQRPKQDHDDDDRSQPKLLANTQKCPDFLEKRHEMRLRIGF